MNQHELEQLEQLELWNLRRSYLFEFMLYMMPELIPNWHHEVISDHLTPLAFGHRDDYVIQLPPQIGKSTLVSRYLPAFLLGHNPKLNIVIASYSSDLASSFCRDIQRIIDSDKYRELFPETFLSDGKSKWKRTDDFFETVGYGGYVKGVGVGGSLTGRRADCLVADTMIITKKGIKPIHQIKIDDEVLSFNHENGLKEFDKVIATRKLITNETIKISTANGRHLEGTTDHRLFTNGCYRKFAECGFGETLFTIDCLHEMQSMLENIYTSSLRIDKENIKTIHKKFLLERMQFKSKYNKKTMRSMWRRHREKDIAILQRMQKQIKSKKTKKKKLPCLHTRVPTEKLFNIMLLKKMCRYTSQPSNEKRRKSKIHRRKRVSSFIRKIKTSDTRTRRKYVCSVFHGNKFSCSSHRRQQTQQSSVKFNYNVQNVPYNTSQIKRDPICNIERASNKEIFVYDIQTEKNHNFFANGILVHNCLIIDDPVKGRQEADSPITQRRNMEWYRSVAETRCHKNSSRIITHTPWSLADISFQLMEEARQHEHATQWKLLRFPAIADGHLHPDDPRSFGDSIFPEFYGTPADLEQKRIKVGERDWSALYQCTPTPTGGAIIKTSMLRYYTQLPCSLDDFDEIIQSWDLRFSKNAKENDFVVGQVWGAKGSQKFLLDHVRGRWGFRETLRQFQMLTAKWPHAYRKLVENKANGPALEDFLNLDIGGIILWEPQGNKQQRLYRCEPAFEAGNVFLPKLESWCKEVEFELINFPAAPHDDIVDSATMALIELMKIETRDFECYSV